MFPSPLIPGFSPDPSITWADGAYYLATSTFEYLPGIPVYRSTDLATWTHIGNVATRPEQVGVEDAATGGGVWAPTIRYHGGVFYIIVTVAMSPRGCVVFTATDPAGPWSDGISINGVGGIDPDLAWDDDGTAYVTFSGLTTSGEQMGQHLGIQQVPGRPERAGKALDAAALAVVWHRAEVPGGAAPVPPRRLLVPADRRGRHRTRAQRQRGPGPLPRGPVRGGTRPTRCSARAARPGRSRTPGTRTWWTRRTAARRWSCSVSARSA